MIAWFRRWSIERRCKAIHASSSDAGGVTVVTPLLPILAAAVAAPGAYVLAPTVSEDEHSAELIIPDCQDGASGAGDI